MPIEPMNIATPHRRTSTTRAAGGAGAVMAAVIAWLVARYGAGVALATPGFSATQHPTRLAVGFVVAAAAVASLAGWGVAALIERAATRPRTTWVITGLVAAALSLSAPLSGHGITGTQRLALACMHLAVAAVLIPAFAASLPSRRRSGETQAESSPTGRTSRPPAASPR